jgi:hypothetical protein
MPQAASCCATLRRSLRPMRPSCSVSTTTSRAGAALRSKDVKTSGLRWVCLMLLAPISWAQRVWALPFLTVLAPSERYHQALGQRHTQLPNWALWRLFQIRHWLPERVLVVVADSRYAAIELLAACQRLPQPVTVVTRVRLDAALYALVHAHPARRPGQPRTKGARQPTLEQRLSDPTTDWQHTSVRWYGGRMRTVRLASVPAVWYHSGVPPATIHWVLITDPDGEFEPRALVSANPGDTLAFVRQHLWPVTILGCRPRTPTWSKSRSWYLLA